MSKNIHHIFWAIISFHPPTLFYHRLSLDCKFSIIFKELIIFHFAFPPLFLLLRWFFTTIFLHSLLILEPIVFSILSLARLQFPTMINNENSCWFLKLLLFISKFLPHLTFLFPLPPSRWNDSISMIIDNLLEKRFSYTFLFRI